MRHTITLFAALLFCAAPSLNAAGKADRTARDTATAKPKERTYLRSKGEQKLDLPYKIVGKKELCLDIYYPSGKPGNHLPTLIFTHGGGWAAGSKLGISKGALSQAALRLLDAGFCVVSVEYRLCDEGNKIAIRDCVIDCKDAARYLAKHSESLGLDPKRFFVLGDSAGGQIAQMLAAVLSREPAWRPGTRGRCLSHGGWCFLVWAV